MDQSRVPATVDGEQHPRASWPPQHVVHELQRVRGALGFASPDELRQRVASTFCSGVYAAPSWLARRRVLVDGAAQTDGVASRRDVGVMNGATTSDAQLVRDTQLDATALRIPRPGDFPVLTAAQLAEAETRVSVLLRRIEQELDAVEQEEATSRRQAASLDPYGSAAFKNTRDWNDNMKKLVSTRLDVKYQLVQDPSIREWHRVRQQDAASPLRQRRSEADDPNSSNHSSRYGQGPMASSASAEMGGGPRTSSLAVTQRWDGNATAASKRRPSSLEKARAAPLFPEALAFFGGYQQRLREQQDHLAAEFAAQRQQLQQQQGRSMTTAAQILGLGGSQAQHPSHTALHTSPGLGAYKSQPPPPSLGGGVPSSPGLPPTGVSLRRTPTPT